MAADRLVRAAVPVDPDVSGPGGDAGAEVPQSVWHSAFVQNVLPFLTSLGVHATLIVVGVLTYQAIVVATAPATQAQAFAPDTDLAMSLPVGIEEAHLGSGDNPLKQARQDSNADVPPEAAGFTAHRSEAFDLTDPGGGEGTAVTDDLTIGLGRDGFGKGTRGAFGEGDDAGSGRGRGGSLAPFGRPGGGIPSGSIFANRKVVGSVAYVCDASGSMLDKFEPLRDQIHRSVESLKAVQSFNVIFFQEAQAAGLSKAGLLRALPPHKREAQRFLQEVYPSGQTDPIPALDLAFRQQPELIWLLTDGDFPDNDAVLAFIRARNPGGKVRINTIAFVTRDDGYERVLRTIADENGGQFRFVGEAELE